MWLRPVEDGATRMAQESYREGTLMVRTWGENNTTQGLTERDAARSSGLGHGHAVVLMEVGEDIIEDAIVGAGMLVWMGQEVFHHLVKLCPIGAEEARADDGWHAWQSSGAMLVVEQLDQQASKPDLPGGAVAAGARGVHLAIHHQGSDCTNRTSNKPPLYFAHRVHCT